MILQAVGTSGLCLPSQATVQQLFSVARDAGAIPDISLDPILTAFLSMESRASLLHQYASLQRAMTPEHLTAFRHNVSGELGGSSRARHGGVGVVALALSVLFDLVAKQAVFPHSPIKVLAPQDDAHSPAPTATDCLFGIRRSSRIGRIIHGYLREVPGVANHPERMAETTELYDTRLKLELIDHYERMTTKKRMGSQAMRQWLAGAAVHLHMRIHQVRLQSVPPGSAESLRLSYRTAFSQLVRDYGSYLRRNIRETPPLAARRPTGAPRGGGRVLGATPPPPRLRDGGTEQEANAEANGTGAAVCAGALPLLLPGNVSLACPKGPLNGTTAHQAPMPAFASGKSNEVTGSGSHAGPREPDQAPAPADVLSGGGGAGHATAATEGLLVIEAKRNVSHHVQHRACESPAIEQALAARLLEAQDLEESRDFFLYSPALFSQLLSQRGHFDLKIRWRKTT